MPPLHNPFHEAVANLMTRTAHLGAHTHTWLTTEAQAQFILDCVRRLIMRDFGTAPPHIVEQNRQAATTRTGRIYAAYVVPEELRANLPGDPLITLTAGHDTDGLIVLLMADVEDVEAGVMSSRKSPLAPDPSVN
jgi:hypothetical protein